MKIRGLAEKLGPDRYRDLHDPMTQMALALAKVRAESQVYAGTVAAHVKAKRRAQNKRARAARRITRRSS